MAKLYRSGGSSSGERVEPEAGVDGLRVQADDAPLVLPWAGLRGRLGGYDDAWVVFASEQAPGVELWVEPEFVRGPMAERRGDFPGDFAERFDELLASQRQRAATRKGFEVLVRGGMWALRLAVVAAILAGLVWLFAGGPASDAIDWLRGLFD